MFKSTEFLCIDVFMLPYKAVFNMVTSVDNVVMLLATHFHTMKSDSEREDPYSKMLVVYWGIKTPAFLKMC